MFFTYHIIQYDDYIALYIIMMELYLIGINIIEAE